MEAPYPINVHSGQNEHNTSEEILQAKEMFEKYMKEKCYLEHYETFFLKYFVKPFLFPNSLSNV